MSDQPTSGVTHIGVGDPALDRLKATLSGWRSSLLDLGGRNRLLNFRHTRTATLEITSPDSATVLSGLARGWSFAKVEDAPVEGVSYAAPTKASAGIVTQKSTQALLDAALYRLRQKSHQMFNDYGLWVLWLGVGMLDWREPGADESSSAPLVLVPVELYQDGQQRTGLRLAEGQDRVHNPALAVKLDQLGVDWGTVAECDVTDLRSVLTAARDVARTQHGWEVSERLVLGLFASHKEAMYQDLRQNEEQILGHPLIRAVALGPDSGLPDDLIGFELPDPDRIDEIQLPEQTPLVVDADSSQRQCIAAALESRSFVMSGPPGTGKSQTITNMIATLMHAGRSVLFVSEKAAALDVVRNRLRDVGLGDFVMALHSGDTSKKAVAQELARVLTTEARLTGAAAHELDRARRLREELSAYATAMNEPREPLGRTLHDVLGRLVLLEQDGTPHLALGDTSVSGTVNAAAFQGLIEAAEALGRAWRPVAEGDAFAWRGVEDRAATSILAEAAGALEDLLTAVERRPFAAATPEPRTPHDVEQLVHTLGAGLTDHDPTVADAAPEDIVGTLAQLADLFGLPKPQTAQRAFELLELADLTTAAERPPRHWFDLDALEAAHRAAQELRQAFTDEATACAAAQDVFGEQVRDAEELPALVHRFAEEHRGVMARFSSDYKADRATVTALTRDGVWDKTLPGRLGQALAWQNAAAEVIRLTELHRGLLSRYAPRSQADLSALDRVLGTAARIVALTRDADSRDMAARCLSDGASHDPLPGHLAHSARVSLTVWCATATQRVARWTKSAAALLALFDRARQAQLSPSVLGAFDQAQQVVAALGADPRGPEEWRAYHDALAVLDRQDVGDLVPRAAERGISPTWLPALVELAVLRSWADAVLATDPRLRTTRSADLDVRVADFQEADRRLVAAARGAVIEACNERRPRRISAGPAAVITRQAELKRRHMPVRDLLGRTREIVQLVKPCFMMSPLTVSQFLPADYHFDVVIFDEASQVRPGDAVNCIYRGSSLIVAGDEKQLPPTSFFDSSVEDDSDEYDEAVPDTFESLLHACKAGALRELSLRWHYRSRHEDLITFSNRSFYGNSMVTFPSALDRGDNVGVAFFQAHGVYDRGGRRDNRAEAEFVAQRVIHHFDTRPDRTLGVVALSQAQAYAIDQAVQEARLRRPDLNHCFTEDRLDGFFVKNLESVQGDERDVMIMSVGYGPDEHGRLGMNFGPINNKEGGWRRLNVAVTRARFRMEVVASFHGGSLNDSANQSVQHLKRYLEYAENGPAVLAQDVTSAGAEPDSPFEESVLQVLRGWGYEVQPQVGVAGYRIDIGVRHPQYPGSYALGIECDGAMYHSSKAARDRDRLREQVLVGLGWHLHRIWGTDWYRGRTAAERRLREAIESAINGSPLSEPVVPPSSAGTAGRPAVTDDETVDARPPQATATVPTPERVPVDAEPDRPWSALYETCDMSVGSPYELHTSEARPALRKLLTRIVGIEGPIHEDLLVQRAREAWGVARAGQRIRDNIHAVVRDLARAGKVTVRGSFLDVAGRAELDARFPGDGSTPRKAAHIAPAERHIALHGLAAECPGLSRGELIRHACEYFGWRRTGRDIRSLLESDIDDLREQGKLAEAGDRITVCQ